MLQSSPTATGVWGKGVGECRGRVGACGQQWA